MAGSCPCVLSGPDPTLSAPKIFLVVDAGNSRVKWALHDGGGFSHEGSRAVSDLAAVDRDWSLLPRPDEVLVANVAGEHAAAAFTAAAARWRLAPRLISAQAKQCGVVSRYESPGQLGPDRWAALIGARAALRGALLVVCAGTAVTVDALTGDGIFLGGLILPGFDLMHDALAAGTARLTAESGEFRRFPRATRDAISSGAIQAICGAVQRMSAAMEEETGAVPAIVASGGTAQIVARHLGSPVEVRERLVLEGLLSIGGETA